MSAVVDRISTVLFPLRRLSIEVDQLLSELPPPSTQQPKLLRLNSSGGNISKLHLEEKALRGQVHSLSGRRGKLSGELNGLLSQVRVCVCVRVCIHARVCPCLHTCVFVCVHVCATCVCVCV